MKTDSPHILCINPWIHDFAAYDFWAKPLGLLSIAAILRQNRIQVSFLDCLDRFHPKETTPPKILWDGRGPFRKKKIDPPPGLESLAKPFSRYGIEPKWFEKDLQRIKKPDLIFVTSLMTYWASGVKETIGMVKQAFPDVPVVLGGIYASLCRGHAEKKSGADRVIQGPAEGVLKSLIAEYTGFEISGPGPSRNLDHLPFPALDLQNRMAYAPILTSRGCPFSCEYCASSFLEPTVRRRSPDHVFKEIVHWHHRFKVRNFAFYDDALLVDAERYAFPLLEKIIGLNQNLFFHTPNALHIKAVTRQAANLMYRAGFKTIRLGLETTDFSTRRQHDVKVRQHQFFAAVEHLKTAGFEKKQLGAYLLCGLPDQDPGDVEISMKRVARAGITPVLAYYTPIPHTPMWENAVKKSRYDLLKHPVFTNNALFPCVRSDRMLKQISRLKNMKI
ncbi:MAG: B12-binding domain-containing radical SAM protein [Desulfobacterales bacterium]|nr:B12-binding domain-containing radical SAM protein [Desulfobacterales bacterium]